jgi:hypothetical protein
MQNANAKRKTKMGLNITTQSGSFDPWVKFNGKSGRWYIKGADGEEVEVNPTSFVADFEGIKTGWLWFAAGLAPDRVWDKSIKEAAPKPSENHKRGFSLRLFSQNTFGGVVDLSSSSMHICNAINELYEAYEAGLAANPGMVPVVKYNGTSAMKDKHGTNYKPNFSIEKWVARPAAFESDAAPAPQAAPAPVAAPVASSVSEF